MQFQQRKVPGLESNPQPICCKAAALITATLNIVICSLNLKKKQKFHHRKSKIRLFPVKSQIGTESTLMVLKFHCSLFVAADRTTLDDSTQYYNKAGVGRHGALLCNLSAVTSCRTETSTQTLFPLLSFPCCLRIPFQGTNSFHVYNCLAMAERLLLKCMLNLFVMARIGIPGQHLFWNLGHL